MTVRGYTRVSSQIQVDGYSLAAQRAKIEAWAGYQDLRDVVIYEDAGISGARDDRPGLTALLLDLQPGDVVVAYALSRLARGGAVQLLGIVRDIREKGARVVFLTESIDTDTPTGRLMLTILAALAELEVEQTRERAMMGKTQAAQQGVFPQNPDQLPTGWATDEEGRIVEDAAQAEVVRWIFAQGTAPYHATAAALNARGVPTRRGVIGGWRVFQVRRVVNFAGYWRGELLYRDEANPAGQVIIPAPALVTQAEWEAAQRPRHQNAARRRPDIFPLTGHLRCRCGTRLGGHVASYQTVTGERHAYYTYRCHITLRQTPQCSGWDLAGPTFRGEALHAQARELLADLLSRPDDPAYLTLAWQESAPSDPHARERDAVGRKLSSLLDLHLEGLVDRETYTRRHATLTRRLHELSRPQVAAPAVMPARPDLAAAVLASTNEELAELLDLLEESGVIPRFSNRGYKPPPPTGAQFDAVGGAGPPVAA